MSIDLIRELWDYHHWANRRLFDVTAALGDEVAGRDLGKPWSVPTLRGMFTHVWGADRWWLERFKGLPQTAPPGSDMFYGADPKTLADLRTRWDELEAEQRRYIATVGDADLTRTVTGTTSLGATFHRPFGMLLVHVANHATHHRSEIAAMLTIVSGSPPDTGINSYYGAKAASSG